MFFDLTDTKQLLTVSVALVIILIPVAFLVGLYLISAAANNDFIWTRVQEARAKAILYNGKFSHVVMSYREHRFRGNTDLTPHEEEVIEKQFEKRQPRPVASPDNPDSATANDVWKKNLEAFMAKKKRSIDPHRWDVIPEKWFAKKTTSPAAPVQNPDPNDNSKDAQNAAEEYIQNSLGGVHLMGIPLIHTPHTYRFVWTSLEDVSGQGGEGRIIRKFETSQNDNMDYILLQQDVYYAQVDKAETKEAVPIDLTLAITAQVVNPMKALFSIQHWLEAITNHLESDTREFIVQKSFDDLFTLTTKTDAGQENQRKQQVPKEKAEKEKKEMLSTELMRAVQKRIRFWRREYGVCVSLIQIHSIEPDPKYRELSTKVYEAERKAEAVKIEAEGEEARIQKTYGGLNTPEKRDAYKWDKIAQSKLTTLIDGKSNVRPAVNISPSATPEPQKGQKNKQSDPET